MINSVKKGVQQLKENRFLIGLSFLILLIGQYTIDSQRRPSFWPKTYILLAVVVILLVGLLLSTNRMDKIAKNTFILIFLLGSLNSLILPIRRNLDDKREEQIMKLFREKMPEASVLFQVIVKEELKTLVVGEEK